MFDDILRIIQSKYPDQSFIPLHEPKFVGKEKEYLMDCIDSTFVSSVGEYVDKFENMICDLTGSKYAVAIVNGTNALHLSLLISGVEAGDEVITQSLSFIATANAISYSGAIPVFIDVDKDTLGMSPESLSLFLNKNARMSDNGVCYNKITNNRIKSCIPMHTFGHPCKIDELASICNNWNIKLIEDAAESIGSIYKGKQTGTYGELGIFSFNGNKTITAGGGGAIITDDEDLASQLKHLSTQAKIPHQWEFKHDRIGYNYRMPNLNAALACAQLEKLEIYIEDKRQLAAFYNDAFSMLKVDFQIEPNNCKSNYWLNSLVFSNKSERDDFLKYSNSNGVMTRPIWNLISSMKMYSTFQTDSLKVSKWLSDRLVNIPSSVRIK